MPEGMGAVRKVETQRGLQGGSYADEEEGKEREEGCGEEESPCEEESRWQEEEVASVTLTEAIH